MAASRPTDPIERAHLRDVAGFSPPVHRLAPAPELSDLVRSTIKMGDRDASEAPWLLLLALLQLRNLEKDFEEMAMDYCVTFEVSPPSFETPQHVATSNTVTTPTGTECFMLPALINSGANALFDAIDAYAEHAPTVMIDCSRLARARSCFGVCPR